MKRTRWARTLKSSAETFSRILFLKATTFIVDNVVHVPNAEQNRQLVRRVASGQITCPSAAGGSLDEFHAHQTLMAAALAGGFLVVAGKGDVYSTEDVKTCFNELGWSFVQQRPFDLLFTLIVAEAS
jgi:hypothetical protein